VWRVFFELSIDIKYLLGQPLKDWTDAEKAHAADLRPEFEPCEAPPGRDFDVTWSGVPQGDVPQNECLANEQKIARDAMQIGITVSVFYLECRPLPGTSSLT
jgi:hypothetical protein